MKKLVLLFSILFTLQSSFATTFTVNSLAATNTGAANSGTLYYCMNIATITPGGPHTIVFSVAGTIPIAMNANVLPNITSSGLMIDGTTAPGYAGVPVVIIDGAGTTSGNGFSISTQFVSILGIDITNSASAGITISAAANGFNIDGCVVRNSGSYGISVNGASSGSIQNCKIGVDNTGATCQMNQYDGIDVQGGGSHQILNNHIACNGYNGIQFDSSDDNVVQGNIIGPLMGTCTYNGYRGIDIENGSMGNIIGGTFPGEGNKIAGNEYWGIEVKDVWSIGNVISGNSMVCNVYDAIEIGAGGNNNIVPPVITAANGTSVSGTSGINAVIEVFRAQDATVFGCAGTPLEQGADYLGTVTADGAGNWTMTGTFNGYVTATQRSFAEGTSAFSNAFNTGVVAVWTNGCAGPFIPVGVAPTANFSATPTTICVGECIDFADLSTDTPTSWAWTFTGGTPNASSSQDQTVCYLTPGVYSVTLDATNANGTGSTSQNITVLPLPTIVIAQNGTEIDATLGHATYQWYLNGTILTGETNDTLNLLSNGDYTCIVVGTNGCTDTSAIFTVSGLGYTDFSFSDIKLYPNPAKNFISIDLGKTVGSFSRMTITDISGNIVYTSDLNSESIQSINIETLADGIYFIQLTGDENHVVRFCKE